MTEEERLKNAMIYGTSHPEIYKSSNDEIKELRDRITKLEAENAKLREALKNWDALITHHYTGSRKAMSDMTYCAQETAKLLYGPAPWPSVPAPAPLEKNDDNN